MSRSLKKPRKKDLKPVPSPGNTAFENPCLIVSVADLTPEKLCNCATQLLQQVSNVKTMLQNPESIVTSIWPSGSFLFGPVHAGGSPGWWFSVDRPVLKLGIDSLSVGLKCGVKKTRGALQFTWRRASHTFEINIPAEIAQYKEAIAQIDQIEQVLTALKQTICQLVPQGDAPQEIRSSFK